MVDARLKRNGRRFYYKSADEAKVEAERLANERARNGTEALEFSTELRVAAVQAAAKLRPWDKTIGRAIDHYIKFLEGERAKHDSLLVQDVVDRYLTARRTDHEYGELSGRSLHEIVGRANQLRAAFNNVHVGELDAKRMRDFLDSYPVGARTRTNIKLRASKLFNWCRDQGLIELNPVERIKFRLPEHEIKILSIDQVGRLLRAVESSGHGDLVAFTALGLWGYMRVGEIRQLRWEQVDLDNKSIEVKAKTTKVRRRRFTEVGETLAAWLAAVRHDSGQVVQPNFRRRWERATKGLDLSANVLRHSAISYGLAYHADEAWVARQAGTSVGVIKASYESPLPRVASERFFDLRPSRLC